MDYERIEKPLHSQGGGGVAGGGGFSPKKLRAMLLGVEKKRRGEPEEVRSDVCLPEIDENRSISDECKDVDVVSTLPESFSLETNSGNRLREQISAESNRIQEEDSFDPESGTSNFEFHKERAANRPLVMPLFVKHTPSKWDDAQKWISNPTPNWPSRVNLGPQAKKMEKTAFGIKHSTMKAILEANVEIDTKKIDPSYDRKEFGYQKSSAWASIPHPEVDLCTKMSFSAKNTVAHSADMISHLDSSTTVQSATTFISPPPTVRSVSMRDMGTEMTPIASQEPSRTGTPARATSPNSSLPSTPRSRTATTLNCITNAHGEMSNAELSKKELQMRTRREIMLLGTQLGKTNIAAWASKQEEEKNAALSLKTLHVDQTAHSVVETRAAAWEEAEKAKYLARFKREEIKIQAWEDHQKAQIEAEMRKIEVEVEKMRSHAQDRLMSKLASIRHKAEGKRAIAEGKRKQAAAKTVEQGEYIRRTGRIPSAFSCWSLCL